MEANNLKSRSLLSNQINANVQGKLGQDSNINQNFQLLKASLPSTKGI
jgi:hypothetical protein